MVVVPTQATPIMAAWFGVIVAVFSTLRLSGFGHFGFPSRLALSGTCQLEIMLLAGLSFEILRPGFAGRLAFGSGSERMAFRETVGDTLMVRPERHCALLNDTTVVFDRPEDKFDALADAWDDQNVGDAKMDFRSLAFLQIIGMGPEAVPFLMRRLEAGETRWIYALKRISGEEAESPEMFGDASRVIEGWVTWWRRRQSWPNSTSTCERVDSSISGATLLSPTT